MCRTAVPVSLGATPAPGPPSRRRGLGEYRGGYDQPARPSRPPTFEPACRFSRCDPHCRATSEASGGPCPWGRGVYLQPPGSHRASYTAVRASRHGLGHGEDPGRGPSGVGRAAVPKYKWSERRRNGRRPARPAESLRGFSRLLRSGRGRGRGRGRAAAGGKRPGLSPLR